jgi:hypothetical protein
MPPPQTPQMTSMSFVVGSNLKFRVSTLNHATSLSQVPKADGGAESMFESFKETAKKPSDTPLPPRAMGTAGDEGDYQ